MFNTCWRCFHDLDKCICSKPKLLARIIPDKQVAVHNGQSFTITYTLNSRDLEDVMDDVRKPLEIVGEIKVND